MDRIGKTVVGVHAAVVVALASGAWALPIELRDQNGTRHNINS